MATSTPPGSRTELGDVLTVLDLAGSARVWIDGGWGVDALLGRQTRDHGDLDLAIEARHLDAFVGTLSHHGFTAVGEDGATAWNFLLAGPGGAVVDLHVIVLDEHDNGVLGPVGKGAVYPAESLTGHGVLGDRPVSCIAAAWVVRFHDAYAGDADDRADVRALCDRFGLVVPEQYR
ncbi:hypothetical protein GCM10022223_12040 [Kineosporia mesophila]|uniref:Lincosamide nucleotidyltransferase A/C/D/E n=1 Tax=Kineosporia mesophila TaxID=566012 RepID=A0ABP6Z5P4_9ACTN|nr:hypothetical protein [Kineosporia mesophila]MCD5352680.1 hypothetical protein [Kineosporia mesophila]